MVMHLTSLGSTKWHTVAASGSCFYTLSVFWMLETSETERNTRVLVKKLRNQGNCLDVFNFE
jgi:hypothetical protein